MQYLNKNRWFWRNSAGHWVRKRVSAVAEKQFSRRHRLTWQGPDKKGNAVALVKVIMEEKGMSLASAWDEVKWMFNNRPGVE